MKTIRKEDWVSLACNPRSPVVHFKYFVVSDGYAHGYDGSRLHRAESRLKNGWYMPFSCDRIKEMDKEVLTLNINQIIKEMKNLGIYKAEDHNSKESQTGWTRFGPVIVKKAYAEDAKPLFRSACAVTLNNNHAIYGRSEHGSFIIGGMRN